MKLDDLVAGRSNFVLIGEAGCGKSELALNLACALAARGDKPVHFFDLDMTKPLFRSRDAAGRLQAKGITVHYEEQFMDAPTAAGGVRALLRDDGCYVVMDVGGDSIGARAIGGYAPLLGREDTGIFYVINPYRVWSTNLEHIDLVLAQTLGVAHLDLQKVQLVSNVNLGQETAMPDVINGILRLEQTVAPYKPIEFHCVEQRIYDQMSPLMRLRMWPIRLYLTYPWVDAAV